MKHILSQSYLDILACPQTGESLSLKDGQLVSAQSSIHYPIIQGIPWLLKNPLHSMVDWSVKLNQFNQVLTDETRLLENELKSAKAVVLPRLKQLLASKQTFQRSVNQLVSPILSAKVASKPVYDALSDRAPITQNLLSYESNLYRDWIWGKEENQLSLSIVKDAITSRPEKMLVLGAGGCRLAYDLHSLIQPELTIANDINPLLLFAASKLISGENLNLPEFPAFPKNAESVAISHTIQGLPKPPENFHFLFGDGANPAIQKASIDTLITPWLVDIQPLELGRLVSALNQYLPVGGQWINFGSLIFNQKRNAYCYSIEEIKEVIEEQGFELHPPKQNQIPYLQSPYNAGFRMETVWSWRAVKTKDVENKQNFQSLPDWIIDTEKPVPASRELQSFAFSHQMYAELSQRVDGKKSLSQIADKIAREKSIDKQESLSMVKNFFVKIMQGQI